MLNKADVLDDERRRELSFRHPEALLVSAVTGEGLERAGRADRRRVRAHAAADVELLVPFSEGGTLSELHALAGDMERTDTPEGVLVTASCPPWWPSASARYAVNGKPA